MLEASTEVSPDSRRCTVSSNRNNAIRQQCEQLPRNLDAAESLAFSTYYLMSTNRPRASRHADPRNDFSDDHFMVATLLDLAVLYIPANQITYDIFFKNAIRQVYFFCMPRYL